MNQQLMETKESYPMKWHKFLIYFTLWFSAIGNAIYAIMAFTGSHYGDESTIFLVYQKFPALKAVDITAGLFLMGIAVFTIYVRFLLAKMNARGPRMLGLIYILNAVYLFLYTFVATNISKVSLFDMQVWYNIAMSLVMVFINRAYYQKRAELFQ